MVWFRNLSITLKISLSFLLLFGSIAGFGIWTYQFSGSVSTSSTLILEESQPFAQLAEQMSRDTIQVQQWLTDISATRARDGLNDGFAEAEKSYRSIMNGLDRFEQMFKKENELTPLKTIRQLRSEFATYYRVGKRMAQTYIDEGPAGGNKMMTDFDKASEVLSTNLKPFLDGQTKELRGALLHLQESAKELKSGVIIICLTVAVFAAAIGFLLSRSISGPIRQGVVLAGEIAKGDFSQRLNLNREDEIGVLAKALDSMAANLMKKALLTETIADGNLDVKVELASEKDQLGISLQRMTDSLNEIFDQIQTATEQIATGGSQVADASQSLSQGATESAASLEQITSSMNVMSGQTRQNAENSHQATLLSDEARGAAEKSNQQMQTMVLAMSEINDASQNINRIIKTIDEIAFQTNLLALNAAVEAARAGQHGKGFAVVAEEVRNLAARSAKAAEETAELIEGSVEKTNNGTHIASKTSEALQGVVGHINKVNDLVTEISASSNEQADGISQVDQGLTQIDQVTQRNTASAEESAAAAEELAGQAASLRQLLTRFTLRNKSIRPQQVPATPVSAVGWKNMGHQPLPTETASPVLPPIALDDEEFGKY